MRVSNFLNACKALLGWKSRSCLLCGQPIANDQHIAVCGRCIAERQ